MSPARGAAKAAGIGALLGVLGFFVGLPGAAVAILGGLLAWAVIEDE